MDEGAAVWTTEPHWRRHLLVPMRSQGGLRGVLKLAPKHEAALYTREDLELLETIASLGAVALHNAEVFAELEAMRRLEADVARDDKRLTLGMLGAEISHEIAYPLNFLRYLLREGNGGAPVDARDLEVGARGDRPAGAHVRDAAQAEDPRAAAGAGAGAAARAPRAAIWSARSCRRTGSTSPSTCRPIWSSSPSPTRWCRSSPTCCATPSRRCRPERRSASARAPDGDGTLVLEVWDEGPGIAEEIAATIFNPFVTSKQGSMGLGLAVTAAPGARVRLEHRRAGGTEAGRCSASRSRRARVRREYY